MSWIIQLSCRDNLRSFFQNSMKFNSLKVFYIRGHKEKKRNTKLVFDKNVKSLIAYVIPKQTLFCRQIKKKHLI